MAGKHPIRICLEGLLVLVLMGAVIRMYFMRGDDAESQSSADSRDVSRLIKSRPESEPSKTGRVFGQEPERIRGEMIFDAAEEEALEKAILTLRIVYADSGELASGPFELFSDDCGWKQSYPTGLIKLIIDPGVCSYRVASPADAEVKWSSSSVKIELMAGERADRALFVSAEALKAVVGGVHVVWERRPDWIEISSLPPSGSAIQAGLQVGDVIVEIDGIAVTSADDATLSALLVGPLDEPVLFVLAVQDGAGWTEVPVQVPRQALSF